MTEPTLAELLKMCAEALHGQAAAAIAGGWGARCNELKEQAASIESALPVIEAVVAMAQAMARDAEGGVLSHAEWYMHEHGLRRANGALEPVGRQLLAMRRETKGG